MLVSKNWLAEYVELPASATELAERLTMVGLNHESTTEVAGDLCFDFEVTSNRPDCLGHLGIAREIATVFQSPLRVPDPAPVETGRAAAEEIRVRIESPELCPRYTARIIRGIRVGASPAWLVERLAAIGASSINNIVDITNYVMFETGQPLHAFDLKKVQGGKIVVRSAVEGETFHGIDHREYRLKPGMCVIADAEKVLGLAGIMGGSSSEISPMTVDLLIESAEFEPGPVRQASRALKLRTDASHRFERALDRRGVDWASRRCCELILKIAGGSLQPGVVAAGQEPQSPPPVVLRLERFERLIGYELSQASASDILCRLGCVIEVIDPRTLRVGIPSWRRDLTREVDLIEELARIAGYDKIPDVGTIGMAVTVRTDRQRAIEKVRGTLAALGIDEALTCSLVPALWDDAAGDSGAVLQSQQPMEGVLDRGSQTAGSVDRLRRSLLPSLYEVRRINEHRGNLDADLYEIAKAYLPKAGALPDEPWRLAWVLSGGFERAKGVLEALCGSLGTPVPEVAAKEPPSSLFDRHQQAAFTVGGRLVGRIGVLGREVTERFRLRSGVVAAELDLAVLVENAVLLPRHRTPSPFPFVDRDFNFVVAEECRWADLVEAVKSVDAVRGDSARTDGSRVEAVEYRETFRAPEKDGAGQKRVLLAVRLRDQHSTLAGAEVEQICAAIVSQVKERVGGRLLA